MNTQPEVGNEGYDAGAKLLYDFFREQLSLFRDDSLDPLGKAIVECCLDNGSIQDYNALIPQVDLTS